MKLRAVPIVVAAVLAALLLFGGWFIYRQVTMQSPLEKIVSQYPGVTSAQIDIKPDQVVLNLDLKPQADIAGLVNVVKQKGQPIIGSRTVKLEIADHSNPALNQWWSEAMFPVAEAMENKKYTQITSTVELMKKKNPVSRPILIWILATSISDSAKAKRLSLSFCHVNLSKWGMA